MHNRKKKKPKGEKETKKQGGKEPKKKKHKKPDSAQNLFTQIKGKRKPRE